jgi:hypothetical protein
VQLRLNELAMDGWEFIQMADVPITGQTLKTGGYGTLAVAIFRRPFDS